MMSRIAAIILMFLASQSQAENTPDINSIIEFHEKNQLCLVLLANGKIDRFGLPLQFEVDPEFYSRENRELYFGKYGEFIKAELKRLGHENLTLDERNYLKQKWETSNFSVVVEWGTRFGISGIISWDEPYRNCVKEHNLTN